MTDEFEQQGWVKLGVAATLAKQYTADQRNLLELVGVMLENTLPGEFEVERQGGLFSKKVIHRIRVPYLENIYVLEAPPRGPLVAARTHVVRGIALKTEPIPIAEFLQIVGECLELRAASSASARAALMKFTG